LCGLIKLSLNRHSLPQMAVEVSYHSFDNYYDISVDKYHNYFHSGFVSHNSSKSWDAAGYLANIAAHYPIRIVCCRHFHNPTST